MEQHDQDDTARNDGPRDHPRRFRRLGDRRRRLGVRLGPAGGRRVDCGDPPGARTGRQLDRHRRRLRLRPLRAGRRAGARRGRRAPYVFTKCSLLEGPGPARRCTACKRDSILREAGGSLERLGVDAIDLYQIHWPIPDEDIEEGWAALAELKEEGLVRHIGVSNFRCRPAAPDPADRAGRDAAAAVLADRADVEQELLPYAEREGIGVIVYSPMGSGLLTGGDDPRADRSACAEDDWRKHDRASTSRSSRTIWRWSSGCRRSPSVIDTTPGAVAVAWTLRNPAVDGAIVGFRRPDQVDPILARRASSSPTRTSRDRREG